MSEPICVFDIGGTKLAGGIMLADHTIHCRHELPTRAQEGANAVMGRLEELAHQVLAAGAAAKLRPRAIGVATGGQVEPTTGVIVHATDNIPGWTGVKLAEELRVRLTLPTFVENDANCFALAEAALGAGKGFQHVLVVAVGTGVGAGVIVNGQLYSGWQGKAGEVGHSSLEPVNGRPCTCGRTGCLESYTATRILVARSGYPTIQALAAAYQAGDPIPAVDEGAWWLGVGLASLVHVLGPEALIVGGSVGLLGERYLAHVRHAFQDHAMISYRTIPILPAQLGADSGLLGAGVLAERALALT